MSKKGKGIKKLNTAQQQSTGEPQKKKGIARKDRNATSSEPEQPKKKGVARRDKNATVAHEEQPKKKGVVRRDKNATVKETEAPVKKGVSRRDKNTTSEEKVKKKVLKHAHAAQMRSSEEQSQKPKGLSSSAAKMHETSMSQGLEKKKVAARKVVKDPNAQCKDESSAGSGIKRTGRMHDRSKGEEIKTVKKGGKSGAAFQQSKAEVPVVKKAAKARKDNQTSSSLGTDTKPARPKGIARSNKAHASQSSNIFGGGSGANPKPKKNVGHMESSFTFG